MRRGLMGIVGFIGASDRSLRWAGIEIHNFAINFRSTTNSNFRAHNKTPYRANPCADSRAPHWHTPGNNRVFQYRQQASPIRPPVYSRRSRRTFIFLRPTHVTRSIRIRAAAKQTSRQRRQAKLARSRDRTRHHLRLRNWTHDGLVPFKLKLTGNAHGLVAAITKQVDMSFGLDHGANPS